MKQLIHNGVIVPRYEWKRLHVSVRGEDKELTPEQEEMALAWVKKLGTTYVEDKVFVRNFFEDFCRALNLAGKLSPEDFAFSEVRDYVEKERALKQSLSKEQKKRLANERKELREANREKHGYAIVDGVRTEIGNYTAEPSCIFMGRGKHPLRGRWKEGPHEEDIELNLSPDAPRPPGKWKAILRQPDVMWIARWQDKLSGKMRYVWLSDSSNVKQEKDIEKFEKAKELKQNLARIKRHIWENLNADDLRRRKTATVCFLIDRLKIRIGDEKDPDEADTVGATTLRPGHVSFNEDGKVTFSFLGKDSVPHVFKVELPEEVVRNLNEFSANAKSTLFNGVDSKRVSEFLDEVMEGLSAKVFRTCYASEAVENKLEGTPVEVESPDYEKKYVATMANLEAAKVCNHKRTIPKTWRASLNKSEARLKERIRRSRKAEDKMRLKLRNTEEQHVERLKKQRERLRAMKERLETYEQQMAERKLRGKSAASLRRRISNTRKAINRQKERIRSLKERHTEQRRKLRERLEKRRERDSMMIEKMRLQIETKKETRDYNLGTSLKSYIDPKTYYSWGKQVGYDWKLYYPKSLSSGKFSWVDRYMGNPKEFKGRLDKGT